MILPVYCDMNHNAANLAEIFVGQIWKMAGSSDTKSASQYLKLHGVMKKLAKLSASTPILSITFLSIP